MLIGIDASRANREMKTGVEWYSYYIIQELKKIIPADVEVILYIDKPLRGDLANLPPNWQEKVLNWPLKYLWTQGRLSLEMIFNPPDILFVPSASLPIICPKKSFTTIHDIGFKRFPKCYNLFQQIYLDLTTRFALRKTTKIFVPSEFTKRELAKCYKADENKIIVTPLGMAEENVICHSEQSEESHGRTPTLSRRTTREISRVATLPRDSSSPRHIGTPQNDKEEASDQDDEIIGNNFIIYIGRLAEKKNIKGIVEAFKLFKTENPDSDLTLVLVGPDSWGSRPQRGATLTDDIIHFNWLPPSELSFLLKNSRALVFPSLYEGFGLPILEAFAAGVPVITSKGIATSEVTGNAALLVNPLSIVEIKDAIFKIVSDDALRQDLIQKGLERVKDFSWEKTAKTTWQSIQNFIATKI